MENEIEDVKTREEAAIPMSPRTMCPALIFAASRKERVIGRTAILTVSIRIRAGLSHAGAPDGRRCAINIFGENREEERIKENQSGRPMENVIRRCLVGLNTYGTRPDRLDKIRRIKSGTMIDENPFA